MRLTTVILIASLMQVSASGLAQKISLSESNTSLKAVLKALKTQSGYNFVVTDAQLKKATPVNIRVKNAELEDVLNQVFEKQPLEFEIESKTVIVKDKEPSFLDRIMARFAAIDVRGRVVDEQGKPLVGATVRVKANSGTSGGTDKVTKTNANGEFFLSNVDEDATIQIVFIGYRTKELKAASDLGSIKLEVSVGELEQVDVTYNTGYQKVDPTKATGSFVQIDSALFNRRVGPTVLDRLDGVTSSLIFNNSTRVGSQSRTGQSTMTIRGRSTIFSNAEPLVVLDNFPYEGDIDNLNPNDIESVTILRDAAAASIWGSRAGNGVIVITTKSGKYNQRQKITFNANATVADKPDLYYAERMSNEDFIAVEKFMFDKGAFNTLINQKYAYLSPVVNLLARQREGVISQAEVDQQLAQLAAQDNRQDLNRYVNQNSVQQQYALNISGGSARNQYYFSGGYDKSLGYVKFSESDRLSLTARNTYALIPNKLDLSAGVILTRSKSEGTQPATTLYPYELLADANGNPLASGGLLNPFYADTAGNGRLLDWTNRPLEEMNPDRNRTTGSNTDYLLNTNITYKIIPGLQAGVYYQYQRGVLDNERYYDVTSYTARSLINQHSQINQTTGQVTYLLPKGSILDQEKRSVEANSIRGQLDFSRKFNNDHQVVALAGIERRTARTNTDPYQRLYGYDPLLRSYAYVDFLDQLPLYYVQSTGTLPKNSYGDRKIEYRNNNFSYFGNAAYTYLDRYTVSFSGRKDESNIFGVNTNQKGVPLWSAGLAWNFDRETFYDVDWLPSLKFRFTYGYNGNVNTAVSAYTVAQSQGNSFAYNQSISYISSPPNPELRWERTKTSNMGIDFVTKRGGLSGSIDYYVKNGLDLIASAPIAPSTGFSQFTGNTANMKGHGIDLILNSKNFQGIFKWNTIFQFSYAVDEITDYKMQTGAVSAYVVSQDINPVVGRAVYSMYAYPWAGLDPLTGFPQGYLNGQVSQNYVAIQNSTNFSDLKYIGRATPSIFGNILNQVSYGNIDLSFNITYQFGHYFRRNSLDYRTLLSTTSNISAYQPDFGNRWQKPGDETTTNVPVLIYPYNMSRNNAYLYSDILVEKGDHIRLQDFRLAYTLNRNILRSGISYIQLYFYVRNIGLLWAANNYGIDPNFVPSSGTQPLIPNPRIYAFGLNVNF